VIGLDEVIARCRVDRVELVSWIERAWVLPSRDGDAYVFTETDVARVELICDLRRDVEIDEDALAVVLPLLDQIYGLRRTLNRLSEAIATLPEPARAQLREALKKSQHDG
jgi:chaperone modulatory protein CbpM